MTDDGEYAPPPKETGGVARDNPNINFNPNAWPDMPTADLLATRDALSERLGRLAWKMHGLHLVHDVTLRDIIELNQRIQDHNQ